MRSSSPPATTGCRWRPPGRARSPFRGDLIHASAYAGPEKYRDQDVLVVGAGNTGAEIATDLAEGGAARVWLAVRTPPNVVPRQLGPVPTTLMAVSMDFSPAWLADPLNRVLQRVFVGDLTRYGLPAPRARGRQPDAGDRRRHRPSTSG